MYLVNHQLEFCFCILQYFQSLVDLVNYNYEHDFLYGQMLLGNNLFLINDHIYIQEPIPLLYSIQVLLVYHLYVNLDHLHFLM